MINKNYGTNYLPIMATETTSSKVPLNLQLFSSKNDSKLGKLDGLELNVTKEGLEIVKIHLSKVDDFSGNTLMLERLENAMKNGQKISGADAIFYNHEINEATKMIKINSTLYNQYDIENEEWSNLSM